MSSWNRTLLRGASASLLLIGALLTPAVGTADMNGQEDQQDKEDRQEDLSANNTAFRGAELLERGKEAYVKDIKSVGGDDSASMFWSGDTLNMQVESEHGNRVALKLEFFWFEAGLDRSSDFYVVIIRGNSSPNLTENCLTLSDNTWSLAVDDDRTKLAQFVDVKADTSGQGGSIRWDWSIPFQTYRWEPKQTINVEQSYSLNAGANAKASVNGKASMKTQSGAEIQGKGSLSGNAGAKASHKVSTNYSVTLHRWEMQVNSGPSGIKWGLRPLDPKKATDNGYHEYYLVMQSESPGQPVILPEIRFGGDFECTRKWIQPDKDDSVEAVANNVRVTPPELPECGDGEELDGTKCVSKCDDGEVFKDGSCEAKDSSSDGCSQDSDCSGDKICKSGSCAEAECTRSPECESGEICDNNRCRTVECQLDSDCSSGEKCSSTGRCVEAPGSGSDDDKADAADYAGGPDAGNKTDKSPDQKGGVACALADGDDQPVGFGVALLGLLLGIAGWRRRRKKKV